MSQYKKVMQTKGIQQKEVLDAVHHVDARKIFADVYIDDKTILPQQIIIKETIKMTEYYLEQVRDLERQIAFTKVGYEQKIKALGEQLTNCTLEESEAIIKEIEASTKAMKALEKSYEYNLKEYQKGGKN